MELHSTKHNLKTEKALFFFLLKIALETSVESEALKQFEVRAKKAIETLVSIKAL